VDDLGKLSALRARTKVPQLDDAEHRIEKGAEKPFADFLLQPAVDRNVGQPFQARIDGAARGGERIDVRSTQQSLPSLHIGDGDGLCWPAQKTNAPLYPSGRSDLHEVKRSHGVVCELAGDVTREACRVRRAHAAVEDIHRDVVAAFVPGETAPDLQIRTEHV